MPANSCRTFGLDERMRVPSPAARMIAADSAISVRLQFSADCRIAARPRIAAEPGAKVPPPGLEQGEKVAIIGNNGVGKSTLFDLITGLYQPDQGIIKIKGRDIRELGLETIRGKIAVVSQNPFFYNKIGRASCRERV